MSKRSITIQTYIGYTDDHRSVVRGRVLENRGVVSDISDNWWRNFVNTWKRFNSNEVPHQRLLLNLEEDIYETVTDDEGYFTFDIERSMLDGTAEPIIVDVMLPGEESIPATMIQIDGECIVVSDIDDTIIRTQVSSVLKLKLLYNTIFRNQYQRTAVPGMSRVYRKLKDAHKANFFYISKSPHNLYPYIVDFLDYNQYPTGSIILRDFGLHLLNSKSSLGEKYDELSMLYERFPNNKFLLVGDAAEYDADIYVSLATKYPNQTAGIFIRKVGSKRNVKRIEKDVIITSPIPIAFFCDGAELDKALNTVLDRDM